MKRVQINSYGGTDVIEIVSDAPKPTPSENQILVEVYAASLNPFDYKVREGYVRDHMPLNFPSTLGGDFAGVTQDGDEVYGQAGVYNGGSGSFAEFAAAPVGKIAAKPKNTDFIQAAALPLAGVSALQAIEDHIKLKSNQKILIHGGAGGIGHIAIQIAKSKGAYVATTIGIDTDFVKQLGADEVINYKSEDFSQKLSDFDTVFDTAGGVDERSFKILKAGGIIVSMSGEPDAELAKKYGVKVIGQGTDSNPDRLARLTKLVEDGKVKVNVDKVFSLNEIKESFEHLEKGHPKGKVVIRVK